MKNFIVSIFAFGISFLSWGQGEFITVWDLSKPGGINTQIQFFTASPVVTSITFQWEEIAPGNATGTGSFAYYVSSNYPRLITGLPAGAIIRLKINSIYNTMRFTVNQTDRLRLIDIEQWGTMQLAYGESPNMFLGCENLNISAIDTPNLSGNITSMFQNCTGLTGPSNINNWNMSNITNMNSMFRGASAFNQPIGNWNTSNVTNMQDMFFLASSFNQPLNNWNTSNVTTMQSMFAGASSFNQPLNNWNTSNVTNMQTMFSWATSFNQQLNSWNTSNVTNMQSMFAWATSFNQQLNSWNTLNVTNMHLMFQNASAFNQPLNNWNTANVTNMGSMFLEAIDFNQPLNNWNTSNVTNMQSMFDGAVSFNQSLGSWQFIPNVSIINMLRNSGMSCSNYSLTLIGWAANNPTITNRNLQNISLQYNQYAVNARNQLLAQGWIINDGGQTNCNEFITRWNMNLPGQHPTELRVNLEIAAGGAAYFWETIPAGTSGSGTFLAGVGVRVISGIPVGSTIRLSIAPQNLNAFTLYSGGDRQRLIDVEQWGSAQWTSAQEMFRGCNNLLNITAPDTPDWSNCQNMGSMFRDCNGLASINNINNWNMSNVTGMSFMFHGASAFNQPLNNWNVSNVTNMQSIFDGAFSFNQPLNNWNTANVTNMYAMFSGASAFNQPLNNWNTSNVTDMSFMFYGASWFNQPINQWITGNVSNMTSMFHSAISFNQSLESWILHPTVGMINMLNNSNLDCDNYAQTLMGWQQNNSSVMNRTLGAQGRSFNPDAQAARSALANNQGWVITDSGFGQCDYFITIWDLSLPGTSNSSLTFIANYVPAPSGKYQWESIPAGYSGSGSWISQSSIKYISGLPPSGKIILKISSHALKSVRFDNQNQLIAVTRWSSAFWSSMNEAFMNAPNLEILATDLPNLPPLMRNTFANCTSITNIPNIENWNTANVGTMENTFNGATSFNQDLGSWTLRHDVNLSGMLSNSGLDCFNYASTLSGWAANNPTITNRTLGATGLNFAQFGNQARNTLINSRGWTITDAGQTNCGEFVTYWTTFQPGAHPNQLNFNVSFTDSLQYTWIHVGGNTSGSGFFTNQGAQLLTGIPTNADVRLVLRPQNLEHFSINNGPDRKRFYYVERWGNAVWKNMEGMFYGCESLEQNTSIGFPNTSQVTSMKNMFRDCINMYETGNPWFWDVSSVTNMESMFQNCPNFNEEINGWNVGSVTNMKSMFEGATLFDWDLSFWNVGNVTNFNSMFKGASSFNSWLNDWQTDNATDMAEMFHGASQFQLDLDNWQTYNVTSMKNMFRGASQFQGNISTWLTDNVTDMSGMFYGASLFNSNISTWNTSQVTNMADMFRNASSFDQELNAWNVEQVTNFSAMFMNASIFKRTLHNWNTTNGQYFDNMFNGASIFDGEVNTWDMSNAITVSGMFANTPEFNREIGTWNFPLAEDMTSMFQNATSFNRDLSNWSFPNANNMSGIFSGATQFNQDLSSWNVSNVQQLTSMFDGATSFNQNLGNWQFSSSVDLNAMLNNSGLDCNNYGATLSGWLANNASLQSINLGSNNLNYGVLGEIARDILVNSQGWNISGDNFLSTNPYVLNDGETFAAQLGCYGEFTRDDDPNERLVVLDPNGNSINLNSVSVLATNNFLTPSDPEIVPIQSGGSGYYEITDGANTFRVGKRLFKIEAPGNFAVNGGVRVRLYYDQNDFSGMVNDPAPNGNIANYGWFKSSTGSFQSAIDEMNASPAQLPSAIGLIPVYGDENGVEYVEFLVENFSVFGMYAQTIDAPLPVTLTSFNANCQGETIQLNWRTASEFDASHYIIQNSRDGFIWTDLGEVAAAGTTNQPTNYSFETKNFGGLSYFRLVQVDLDGASEIFGPVSANCELEISSMTVYPNPTAENFSVRIETKESFENATLDLIDNMGRVVLSRTVDIEAGTTTIPFESRDLQAGVYILRLRGEGEKFKPVQVVRY